LKATFEIEQIIAVKEKVYVLVKHINTDIGFTLNDSSTLNDVAIEKWMDVPRAYDAAGNFRNAHYAFVLKQAQDKTKLNVDDIVELNNGG